MRKTYLLWFAILAILMLGCNQDLDSFNNENSKPDVHITHKTSEEFGKNLKLVGKLTKTLQKINEISLASKSNDTIYHVDLDNALYLEDKTTNRHSYIFKTQNPDLLSFDIKNLVLASSPSGDYRAYIVTYTLTEEERKIFDAKGKLNLTGKTSIEPLDMENIDLSNKAGGCWDLFTYQEDCNCHDTHASGGCTHPTTVYEVVQVNCSGGGGGTGTPPPPGDGPTTGGGSPGGGGNNDPILISPDGEPVNDACSKIMTTTNSVYYTSNISALQSKTGESYESGFRMGSPNPNFGQVGIQNQLLQNKPGTKQVDMKVFSNTFALMHSHYDGLFPIFSPGDILFFNQWIVWAKNYNDNPSTNPKIPINNLTLTLVTSNGNYLLAFDGSTVAALPAYTPQQFDDLSTKYVEDYLNQTQTNGNFDMDRVEKEFLKFVKDNMNMTGLKLFKVGSSGTNTEIYLEGGNRKTKDCPN
ncbi:MAG: hypothetical protein E2600_15410 [Chryseobacterium sp.]|nr:hypothetical protein [Chryseobacterium sp.]